MWPSASGLFGELGSAHDKVASEPGLSASGWLKINCSENLLQPVRKLTLPMLNQAILYTLYNQAVQLYFFIEKSRKCNQ